MIFYDTKSSVPAEAFNPETLGGKGYGLVWMTNNGINVPPAIIIPTSVCVEYMKKPKTVMKEIAKHYDAFADFFIDQFGYMPLLSVRSGARVSMPGMMDTILNVGLTPNTEAFWKEKLGETCATDCNNRLYEMYCATVLGMNKEEIQGAWAAGTKLVPNTPKEQTLAAIEAVFKSWNNDRAKFYRKMHNIPEEWGTAVVLQAMVFGNMGETSCTGVLFTRNPDTGSAVVTGEFLVNAQGEDVVAGVKTPQKLLQMADWNGSVYLELLANVKKMEDLKGDVQDVEFTVQEGKLYILQTRNAKRTPMATVRIAVDYFQEGKLSREEALKRVKVVDYDIANQDVLDPSFKDEPWVTGIPACSGVVTGKVVLSAQAAVDSKEPCILITKETTPDDIAGMFAAKGVVTMEGGATSHAAVVARGMNKPCVVGVGIDVKEFAEGSTVSFDGATGRIWLKEVPVVKGSGNPTLKRFDELLFGNNVVPVGEVVNSKVLINGNIYISDPQALAQLIAKVPKGTKVFLDLTDHDEEIVNEFNSMFYLHGAKMDVQVVSLLANLNSSPLAKTGNLTVFVSGDYVGFPNLKLVVGAGKLEQFLMANGGYWVGDVDPAVMKLMDLKTKAGEKCGVLGAYSEKDECFQSKSSLMARLLS